MARSFNGTTDKIQGTVTAADSGDWTIAAWIKPATAGEGSVGRVLQIETSGGTRIQTCYFDGGISGLLFEQMRGGAQTAASETNVNWLNVWAVAVGCYRASDSLIRIYRGTLSSAMAEATYGVQRAGDGARTTGGTVAVIGNNAAASGTWNGLIGPVCFDVREWTLDEAEAFRQGRFPVSDGAMRLFCPLDSPTVSQAEDLSGNGVAFTATGTTLAEDPPVPLGWWQPPVLVSRSALALSGSALVSAGGLLSEIGQKNAIATRTVPA